MSVKEQYEQFLAWLKVKQRKVADEYWNSGCDAQRRYRLLLLKIQVEILTTEELLGRS